MNEHLEIGAAVGERVTQAFSELTGGLTAADLFGEPTQVGERTILTAVAVERAGGFGFGGGGGTGTQGDAGAGGGGGGGGATQGRPVAVVEIGPTGVIVRPVIDFTRIGITILLAAISLFRARRRR